MKTTAMQAIDTVTRRTVTLRVNGTSGAHAGETSCRLKHPCAATMQKEQKWKFAE
jgi:hypothetical protein